MKRWVIIPFALIGLVGCRPEIETLTVFAAASTQNAVQQVASAYQEKTGIEIEINAASSSTLARQIEMGMPADIFISANPKWMYYLEEQGLLQVDSPCVLLSNRLVLIAPAEASLTPGDVNALLASLEGPLALGDPSHVPAGQYAKQALDSYGGFNRFAERVLPGNNVRAALAYVERGEAQLGIVYATDARLSKQVKLMGSLDPTSHDPVTYMASVMAEAKVGAPDFLTYLQSDEAQAIFAEFGFLPGGE